MTRWASSREQVAPFTRRTFELLDAFQDDFGVGADEEVGASVLLASDFLLETQPDGASWEHFDVGAFAAFLRERVPAFGELLPWIVAALGGFFCFLSSRGVVSERRASAVVAASYARRFA